MTTLIADCETNDLLDAMTKFHMLQLGDADGDDVVIYADLRREQAADVLARGLLKAPIQPIAAGLARIAAADLTVWHNGLGFDLDAVNHFYPGTLDPAKMLDTLVMARLAFPDERVHTLKAWGERVGALKDNYKGDYQTVDDEFLRYSEQDIVVGRALYHRVKHVLTWGTSCALEHQTARCLVLQERNGFTLNTRGAEELASVLRDELEGMGKSLAAVFPPLAIHTTKIAGASNKNKGRVKGQPYTETTMEEFNPKSRHHIAKRLKMLGWKPAGGDDGQPTLDEKVLKSLPYPEAHRLVDYFARNKLLAQVSDGKEGWLRHVKPDGRVHGRVNSNGCVTGRMSHSKPNMANIDKDPRARGLWLPKPGWVLVGCDAEGLEARMLAHYLARYDDGAYGRMVLEGNSDDRTDVHSANLKAAIKVGLLPMACWKECFKASRNGVKTALYAMMYGAQDPKIGEGLRAMLKDLKMPIQPRGNKEMGALWRTAVGNAIVGFGPLTEAVKARAAAKKYLVALDGRHLPVRAQHAALNTLLQGGGAIVMKKALCLYMGQAAALGWVHGRDFGLCANVHDEVQQEVRPELAEQAARLFEAAIHDAGVAYGLRCPLAGKANVGATWAETH